MNQPVVHAPTTVSHNTSRIVKRNMEDDLLHFLEDIAGQPRVFVCLVEIGWSLVLIAAPKNSQLAVLEFVGGFRRVTYPGKPVFNVDFAWPDCRRMPESILHALNALIHCAL